MKAALISIKGNWAHFRKAETNNNPLTHDFITKTALVGMIGAVLGKERAEMRPLFPQLCEDLLYCVQINNVVQKQSWGFTLRSATNLYDKSPKPMEVIRNADYSVLLALKNERSYFLFEHFVSLITVEKTHFQPVLGLHNCPADLALLELGTLGEQQRGEFETYGFVSTEHQPTVQSLPRLNFDRIPTYQTDDFWNRPDAYMPVIYPSNQEALKSKGVFYEFNNQSQWFLI